MPKKKGRDIKVCPNCGYRVEEPVKTWNLVSPLPDAKGRITVTVMASFQCPNCGYKWKGVLSKIKVGGKEIEVEAGKAQKKIVDETAEEERKEVIELSLEDILSED